VRRDVANDDDDDDDDDNEEEESRWGGDVIEEERRRKMLGGDLRRENNEARVGVRHGEDETAVCLGDKMRGSLSSNSDRERFTFSP
jgi:hypothetical protein